MSQRIQTLLIRSPNFFSSHLGITFTPFVTALCLHHHFCHYLSPHHLLSLPWIILPFDLTFSYLRLSLFCLFIFFFFLFSSCLQHFSHVSVFLFDFSILVLPSVTFILPRRVYILFLTQWYLYSHLFSSARTHINAFELIYSFTFTFFSLFLTFSYSY